MTRSGGNSEHDSERGRLGAGVPRTQSGVTLSRRLTRKSQLGAEITQSGATQSGVTRSGGDSERGPLGMGASVLKNVWLRAGMTRSKDDSVRG